MGTEPNDDDATTAATDDLEAPPEEAEAVTGGVLILSNEDGEPLPEISCWRAK